MGKSSMGKSYTMTKQELVDQVATFLVDVLKDNVADYVSGDGLSLNHFSTWHNLSEAVMQTNGQDGKLRDAIEMWCDCMSEAWFDKHPGVDDVLLEVNKTEEVLVKEWLASKE
jgi:hypothetical protein